MKIRGKIQEKYKVINGESYTLQRFKLFSSLENKEVIMTAFGEKNINKLSLVSDGSEVEVEYIVKTKTNGNKSYSNLYMNEIQSIDQSIDRPKDKSNPYKEFYLKANPKDQQIIDSTYNELCLHHYCNLDRYQFFHDSISFFKKYGIKPLSDNYQKLMKKEPMRINHEVLNIELFQI